MKPENHGKKTTTENSHTFKQHCTSSFHKAASCSISLDMEVVVIRCCSSNLNHIDIQSHCTTVGVMLLKYPRNSPTTFYLLKNATLYFLTFVNLMLCNINEASNVCSISYKQCFLHLSLYSLSLS